MHRQPYEPRKVMDHNSANELKCKLKYITVSRMRVILCLLITTFQSYNRRKRILKIPLLLVILKTKYACVLF